MDEKLYTKAVIEKAEDANDFVAVASTPKIDRHGEEVSAEGWDLAAFKKNPVLLWGHDHSIPALGTATKVWVEGKGKSAKLMITGKIHEHTEQARAMKSMVKEGIIRTMSVGFQPKEMEGNKYVDQELLEVSFVNVPANSQALITAYKSLKEKGFKDKTIADLGIPVGLLDKVSTMEKDIVNLKNQVIKVQSSTASPQKAIRNKQSMSKVIAKASDKLHEAEKQNLPKHQKTDLIKIIKRANEIISVAHKEQLKK